ncbi:DUF1616 domain-containing protein [Candidatus Bathyarchaeota archaeon]|nr:DUF1616 domain-containing protein [Candidatus Bathyarchaeota archaeon]
MAECPRKKGTWYWLTISVTLASAISIFGVPESFFLSTYLRYILGVVLLLWLPGYSFIKVLFSETSKTISLLELFVLSIGLSMILDSLVLLFLNYTSWGIRLTSVALSISLLTIVLATLAFIKERRHK